MDTEKQPTPAEIVTFVERLTYWRGGNMTPHDVTYHNYTATDAQTMKAARNALFTMALWQQDDGKKADLEALGAVIQTKMQTSVADQKSGRVEFRFLGSELINLRRAVGHLQDYALIRERDAREASRPRYPKRKH